MTVGAVDDAALRERMRHQAMRLLDLVEPGDSRDTDDPRAADLVPPEGCSTTTLSVGERLALAWALKEAGHAAWNSEPQRSVRAARALHRLRGEAGTAPSPMADELGALADWTEAIADIARGEFSEAAAALDRAAERFRQVGQLHHAAQTQVPKIMVLGIMGRQADAVACAERTLQELRRQADLPAAAKVCLNLGTLALRRDAYAEAARHYREAAVLFARCGDAEHSVMADIGLADALGALGDIDEAARICARARMRAEARSLPVLQAMTDESMALLDLTRGRFGQALSGLERSRRRYDALAMPRQLATAEKLLGDAYLELRLLPEAARQLREAVVRFEALGMPEEQAWAAVQLGRALALQDQPAEAEHWLQQADQAFRGQQVPIGVASVALVRAELALGAGHAALALTLAESAATAFERAGQLQGRLLAQAQAASALLAAGRIDEAGRDFRELLLASRQAGLLPTQVRCLTGLGQVTQALGHAQDAARAFEAAIDLFEDQRRTLPGDELRSAFLTDHLRPYQALLGLVMHPRAGGQVDAARVLWHWDRMRARALAERLAGVVDHHELRAAARQADAEPPDASTGPADEVDRGGPVDLPRGPSGAMPPGAQPSAEEASVTALRVRLNWLYRRLSPLNGDCAVPSHWQDEARRIERELLERVRRGRFLSVAQGPGRAPARAADAGERFSIAALQQRLGPADALVEYGQVDDELFACVVTAREVRLARHLGRWGDVVDGVQSARFQIEALRHGPSPVRAHLDLLERRALQRLMQLHARWWAPLQPWLQGMRRVLVVPHGPLARLPFAALHDGAQPLAERLELAVAPSARVAFHALSCQSLRPQRALCVGESSRLPHAGDEARRVAALFAQGQAVVGDEATVQAWCRGAPQADVLHLACHAEFRVDNPMFSALHLADAPLTAELIETVPLRPAVVVLSACETGLADEAIGDEMVGLVRAFMVAGAARVVASLWPVDDEVTARFMDHFYRSLCAGETPAAALRGAQLALRRTHPHPFHWAAFALHGGW